MSHAVPVTAPAAGLTFLVVDDDSTNRLILKAMVEQAGHRAVLAEDGAQAVARFQEAQPDMVLMDIMMPVLDGYAATEQIRALAGERWVPVIFLTALSDEQSLTRCIEVGGDDFLTKPYNRVILQAKIRALLRTRALYQTLAEQNTVLAGHRNRLEHEQFVAERVFAKVVHRGYLGASNIRYLISPAAIFNGDLLLAGRRPSGGLHVMLGDFTGHGLSAAIGAMPVADIFYRMTEKGFSIGDIVEEINRKLRDVLPTDIFLAACLIDIDATANTLTVWNGGVPDVLVCADDGTVRHQVTSSHLPLGIMPAGKVDRRVEFFDLTPGDRIYLCTDGVIEAQGADGSMFGQDRLRLVLGAHRGEERFAAAQAELQSFRGDAALADDAAFIEITPAATGEAGTAEAVAQRPPRPAAEWVTRIELSAPVLRQADPLPSFVQLVMELQAMQPERERLYTVLAELYNNAVDHGLLGLDSRLKERPEGFVEYLQAREAGLARLEHGRVTLELRHRPLEAGAELTAIVEDSGAGFDYAAYCQALSANRKPHGRGIPLVRSLVQDLRYEGEGRRAIALLHI